MPGLFLLLRRTWPLWIILAANCAVEAILQLSDAGLLGAATWRNMAYQYGGFWSGLLRDWRPNYPAQPWTMFLTYSLLHAGLSHLAGNMATLVWLVSALASQMSARRMTALYAASALGGAAAFALLSSSSAPMVGASGALFGLAGAWIASEYLTDSRVQPGTSTDAPQADPTPGRRRAALFRAGAWCAMLILLNVTVWVFEDGVLAWETHLGGFLTGAGLTLLCQSRPRAAPPRLAKSRS